MTIENARQLAPLWAAEMDTVKVYEPDNGRSTSSGKTRQRPRKRAEKTFEHFKRRYGILLITALAFTLYTVILSASVETRTEKRVWAEATAKYDADIEAYKADQARAKQAEYWLSGDASREAFINQIIEKGAHFIAEEIGDQYKQTKLGVAVAREMNPAYPNDLESVMNQPNQWIRNNPDSKITQHDLDLSEQILRPYYESGIVPIGLTDKIVFFDTATGIARDSYETTTTMTTWRYQG